MGSVSLARDRSLGDRPVALKRLLDAGSEDHRKRFQREAQLLSSVEHPNVVRLLDFGTSEGIPFLVMEYLVGESLADACDDPLGDMIEAGKGLQAIHDQGILHRDLKPENILRTRDGRIVLLDLGLGRSQEDGASLTRTGNIVGTTGFFAPEVLSGTQEPSRQSDWYSWGLSLYLLLKGDLPYRFEKFVAYIQGFGPWPIDWSETEDFPEAAQRILKRVLDPMPELRPRDLDEILDLAAWRQDSTSLRLEDSAVEILLEQPEPPPSRSSRTKRPTPGWLPVLGAFLVGIVLSMGLSSSGSRGPTTAHSSQVAPLVLSDPEMAQLQTRRKDLAQTWGLDSPDFLLDFPVRKDIDGFLLQARETYGSFLDILPRLAEHAKARPTEVRELAEDYGAAFRWIRIFLLYHCELRPRGHIFFARETYRNFEAATLDRLREFHQTIRRRSQRAWNRSSAEAILVLLGIGAPEALGWEVPVFQAPWVAGRFPLSWIPKRESVEKRLLEVLPRLSLRTLERVLIGEGALDLSRLEGFQALRTTEFREKLIQAAIRPSDFGPFSEELEALLGNKLFRIWQTEQMRDLLYASLLARVSETPDQYQAALQSWGKHPDQAFLPTEDLMSPQTEVVLRSAQQFNLISTNERGQRESGRILGDANDIPVRLGISYETVRERYCQALADLGTSRYRECSTTLDRRWENILETYSEIDPRKLRE